MKGLAWVRSVWRALGRPKQLNAGMNAEMRFHIEMEAERLEKTGLSKEDAFRQAHVRFGGLEKYKEEARDTRALPWIDALSVDAKLGARMLWKYRGLTLVGGFAMAVAIAIGAIFFEVLTETMNPALPLPGGDRVVALQFATDIPGSPNRQRMAEFATLRDQLRSIEHVGAFQTVQLNLVSANAAPEAMRAAAMSAAGFVVANTPPLLGRYLVSADEQPGAPDVAVIGFVLWKKRFNSDPNIVGRVINFGDSPTTIVGVMPRAFAFPVDHQLWIPLREKPTLYKPLGPPDIYIFGRLAAGTSMREAQSELEAMDARFKSADPVKNSDLHLVVNPYTREFSGMVTPVRLWIVQIARLLVGALAMVVAVNLAILIYARTVARLGEIAVRTALGASRKRILSQLFMEAFALALVGAVVGLFLTSAALSQMQLLIFTSAGSPFWVKYELSWITVFYALAVAAVAAFVMGVIPGLKATSRGVNANLQQLSGRSGQTLGPIWTGLVVAQIAVAVAALPAAVYLSWLAVRMEVVGPGFETDQLMITVAAMGDDGSVVDGDRWKTRQAELISRMSAEPGVAGVAFSSAVPGFGPNGREIEFEERDGSRARDSLEAGSIYAGLEMLSVYDARLIAGRHFTSRDLDSANAVIVNRTFAEKAVPGGSVLGVRFRYANLPSWYEIVGVVDDFPRFPPSITLDGEPIVYHAVSTGVSKTVVFTARFAGDIPAGTEQKFRKLAAEIDPALQMRRVVPLTKYYRDVRSLYRNLAWSVGLVTASVLLLSAAGIYALMSLSVAQRRREIGIRTALGAQPRRLILNVLSKSVAQIGIGLIVGSILAAGVCSAAGLRMTVAATLVSVVAILMLVVGVLSAFGPARRILKVQATDALRADG